MTAEELIADAKEKRLLEKRRIIANAIAIQDDRINSILKSKDDRVAKMQARRKELVEMMDSDPTDAFITSLSMEFDN